MKKNYGGGDHVFVIHFNSKANFIILHEKSPGKKISGAYALSPNLII